MQLDELKDKLLKMLDGVMGDKSEYPGVKWTLAHLRIEYAVGCLGIACVCATATGRVDSRPSMLRFTYCGAKNASGHEMEFCPNLFAITAYCCGFIQYRAWRGGGHGLRNTSITRPLIRLPV